MMWRLTAHGLKPGSRKMRQAYGSVLTASSPNFDELLALGGSL